MTGDVKSPRPGQRTRAFLFIRFATDDRSRSEHGSQFRNDRVRSESRKWTEPIRSDKDDFSAKDRGVLKMDSDPSRLGKKEFADTRDVRYRDRRVDTIVRDVEIALVDMNLFQRPV